MLFPSHDRASRIKMNQRQAAVGKDGRIEEQNLPDVKMDLKAEAMRQMADRFKR